MREKLVDSDPVRRGGHPVAPDLPPRGTEAADVAESSLVEALQRGNEEAAALLVHRFAGRLLAVARRILRNEDDAQDALQDAFLSAFRSIADFRRGARLSTWLHRIVVNAALMRLRSASRRREDGCLDDLLPTFDESGHQTRPAGAWRAEPEDAHLRSELRARVREAVGELPVGYRTVLLLRDIEELSTQETAVALGVTENAVKVRLHRARQALKTLLDPMMLAPLPGRSSAPRGEVRTVE